MPRPVTIAITFPDGPQQLDVFADAVHHALAVSPIIDTLGVFIPWFHHDEHDRRGRVVNTEVK